MVLYYIKGCYVNVDKYRWKVIIVRKRVWFWKLNYIYRDK